MLTAELRGDTNELLLWIMAHVGDDDVIPVDNIWDTRKAVVATAEAEGARAEYLEGLALNRSFGLHKEGKRCVFLAGFAFNWISWFSSKTSFCIQNQCF